MSVKLIICHRDIETAKKYSQIIKAFLEASRVPFELSVYVKPDCQWLKEEIDKNPLCFDIYVVSAYEESYISLASHLRKVNRRASLLFAIDSECLPYSDIRRNVRNINKYMLRFRPTGIFVDFNHPQHVQEVVRYCVLEQQNSQQFLTVTVQYCSERIKLDDIVYIENQGRRSNIAVINSPQLINASQPLARLYPSLTDVFLWCHASYCVNMNYIMSYDKKTHEFTMKPNFVKIPVSRSKVDTVLEEYRRFKEGGGSII